MKDLYTFDATLQEAERSYHDVKAAYCRIFDAIGLPYRVVSDKSLPCGAGRRIDILYLDTRRLLQTRAISEGVHRMSSTTSLPVGYLSQCCERFVQKGSSLDVICTQPEKTL